MITEIYGVWFIAAWKLLANAASCLYICSFSENETTIVSTEDSSSNPSLNVSVPQRAETSQP